MSYNKLVFGGLALGCMAAAAGGGYLAARPATPISADAAAVAPAQAIESGADADNVSKPVAESEGVITPDAAPALETGDAPAPALDTGTAPKSTSAVSSPAAVTAARPRETASRPNRTAPAPQRRSTRAAPAATTQPRSTDRTAPGSTPATGGMWETRAPIDPVGALNVETEPEAPARPAAAEFVDVVIPAETVVGMQIERTITSENARVEDRVEARVTRDVRVGDKVAIPAGSVVQGSVMEVERGGKIKDRARLGIRFHTVVMANGSRLNIRTDSVIREGASVGRESAAKIGGAAVGGAILGAILGGGKGAVIGGATGAAGGTAATMAGQRNAAVLSAGTTVSVRVQQPVTVTVEK